ncbi:MAG: hypothetical protein IJZ53_10235 [Tyzzerella sp.]|nr:hypothetical protein [Tyzzerella sp.]
MLESVDKNFIIETKIDKDDVRFYDIEDGIFQIYGIFKENGLFRRMPEDIAEKVNKGVYVLHTNTAGGRVRFVTDSAYVAIKTIYEPCRKSHFPLSGSSGFDMYSEKDGQIRYAGTFIPPVDVVDNYESVIEFTDRGERVVTINFPTYSNVKKLYIGLQEHACLKEAPEYKIKKPVVYYGSSITQGACASKPGSCYQSILSRRFDWDYINLGFAGSARGEELMAEYIKTLDMSLFVLDYDHNAPTAAKLEETHSRFFEIIRKAHPTLPILILPRPRYYHRGEDDKRFEIVKNTYLGAKAKGDEHVYFISNKELMALVEDNGSVDNTHPTDSGFLSMARAIGKVFEEICSCF